MHPSGFVEIVGEMVQLQVERNVIRSCLMCSNLSLGISREVDVT